MLSSNYFQLLCFEKGIERPWYLIMITSHNLTYSVLYRLGSMVRTIDHLGTKYFLQGNLNKLISFGIFS